MRHSLIRAFGVPALALGLAVGPALSADAQKRGGTLNFIVASDMPSYDGHIESTFGIIHPIRPFYSLLIRENPDNPASATDFVCDLCVGDVPKGENGGTVFKFKIRDGVKFHDGTPLTSADVKATLDKIVFPPQGVPSARQAYFKAVKSIEAPTPTDLVITLKFPTGSFIPALAMPFNFVYAKKDLDEKGYKWHQKNINGTGAFKFTKHTAGASVEGVRYDGYHFQGKPYLDGFKAIFAEKLTVGVQAIRGDRAAIEFRGFPPKQRDDLVKALGDKITVQESDWNCVLLATPNQARAKMQDPRVRQALTLAVDRWGGSKHLSKIAIVKTVGGVVFPDHPMAATQDELKQLHGYSPDHKASVAKAKELLAAAGATGLEFDFLNRGVDQPYKVVGTWLIGQWRQAGFKATQRVQPSAVFYDSLRKKKDFDVSIDFNCQSVINPIADISKYLGSAGDNYGNYKDQELEDLYAKLLPEGDEKKQRELIRAFEKRALSEQAHELVTLWWYKINPHRSYVKGWKIAPSHYLNQHLDQVWLDKPAGKTN